MDNDRIASAGELATALQAAWQSLTDAFSTVQAGDGTRFDLSQPIPGLGITLTAMGLQIDLVVGELDHLSDAEGDAFLSVPPLAPRRLNAALEQARTKVGEVQELISNIRNINAVTMEASRPKANNPQQMRTVNFATQLTAIADQIDIMLRELLTIKTTLPPRRSIPAFPGLVRRLRQAADQSEEGLRQIQRLQGQAENAAELAEHAQQAAAEHAENVQVLLETAKSESSVVTKMKAEAETAHANIEEFLGQARTLKAQVEEYEPEMKVFQESLDKHRKRLSNTTSEQEQLIERLKALEGEIVEKNTKASDMLSGATVAGLASSFGKTREKLDNELQSARRAFYLSIFALILLASPLFLYVFPMWGFAPPREGNAIVVMRDLLARLALLLPGIWLVGFAAKRHSSLFRLREHYQYKYNMAFSVEGFKLQAQELGPEIAGTTFYEILTHNPADAMDGRRDSTMERRSEPLLSKIVQRLSRE